MNSYKTKAILDNTVDGIISIDDKGIITTYNKSCISIFQYVPDEVIGKNVKMLMPDPYQREHDNYLSNYLETGINKAIGTLRRVPGQKKDGTTFPMELSVSKVNVPNQIIFTGVTRDITQKITMEEEIESQNQELELIFNSVSEGIILIDKDFSYLKVNQRYSEIVGFSERELLKKNYLDLSLGNERHEFKEALEQLVAHSARTNEPSHFDRQCQNKYGAIKILRNTLSYLSSNNAYLLTVIDFTETFNLMAKLENLTVTDELTKVKNRKAYREKVEELFNQFKRYDINFSMLLFDIDNFKKVNDTYGHNIGDDIIVKVALVVDANLRKTDYLYRYGGEEFIILMPNTDVNEAFNLAEKIRLAIEERISTPKLESVTISIGVSEINKHDTITSLFKRVDKALYKAKDNGRNQVVMQNG